MPGASSGFARPAGAPSTRYSGGASPSESSSRYGLQDPAEALSAPRTRLRRASLLSLEFHPDCRLAFGADGATERRVDAVGRGAGRTGGVALSSSGCRQISDHQYTGPHHGQASHAGGDESQPAGLEVTLATATRPRSSRTKIWTSLSWRARPARPDALPTRQPRFNTPLYSLPTTSRVGLRDRTTEACRPEGELHLEAFHGSRGIPEPDPSAQHSPARTHSRRAPRNLTTRQ